MKKALFVLSLALFTSSVFSMEEMVAGTNIKKSDVEAVLPGLRNFIGFWAARGEQADSTNGLTRFWYHLKCVPYALSLGGSKFYSLALSESLLRTDSSISFGTPSERELSRLITSSFGLEDAENLGQGDPGSHNSQRNISPLQTILHCYRHCGRQ